MVHFSTKNPNFKSEYLKNAQIIAKILKVLTKFIKKVYKNLNILLKDAYADKICSKRTFVRCLQVSSSSSLLFSIVWGFSVRMTSFSVKHKSQDWLPLENAWPRAFIDHTTLGVMPLSLSIQTYEDRVVGFVVFLLNDALCVYHLALKSSVEPKYFMILLSPCTSA